MSSALNNVMHSIHRANEKTAEAMGLLTAEKLMANAPLNYRLITETEADALDEAGIPYIKRVCANPISKMGWANPHVYELICKYQESDEFAGLTLSEWLFKTYSDN